MSAEESRPHAGNAGAANENNPGQEVPFQDNPEPEPTESREEGFRRAREHFDREKRMKERAGLISEAYDALTTGMGLTDEQRELLVGIEVGKYRLRLETKRRAEADEATEPEIPLTNGAAFVLDQPEKVPALWGQDDEILWAKGEALMLVGPPGVGKTTITGQLVRALLGLQHEVLGFPVQPVSKVLYLAMDRPRQIGRALARNFRGSDREALENRLIVHQGPPPSDLAAHPEKLLEMALAAGLGPGDVVAVDSLKDAAIGLSEDAVGASYNKSRQTLLRAGIDIVELHHQRKAGANGGKPNTLSDVYGSTWLTSGAGSVVLLWGEAGDEVIELVQIKPVMTVVGPLTVIHDHAAGTSRVEGQVDIVALARSNPRGVTVGMVAEAIYGPKYKPAERERVRRKIEKLVESDHLVIGQKISDGKGHDVSTYLPGKGRGQGLFGDRP